MSSCTSSIWPVSWAKKDQNIWVSIKKKISRCYSATALWWTQCVFVVDKCHIYHIWGRKKKLCSHNHLLSNKTHCQHSRTNAWLWLLLAALLFSQYLIRVYLYPLTHTFFKVNAYYGAESCWHNTSLKCLRRLCQPIKLHLHNFEAPLEKPFHSRLKSSGMCTGSVNYSCLCNYINLAVTELLSFPCGVIGIKESKEARGKQRAAPDYWMRSLSPQEYSFTVM